MVNIELKQYIKLAKELAKENKQLKQQLAECEKEKEILRTSQSSTHMTLMQLNDELLKTQKQLTEKEKQIKQLKEYNHEK